MEATPRIGRPTALAHLKSLEVCPTGLDWTLLSGRTWELSPEILKPEQGARSTSNSTSYPYRCGIALTPRCLQEITYLTSPGALNPLPSRPPINMDDALSSGSGGDRQPIDPASFERPRKELPENPPSALSQEEGKAESQEGSADASASPNASSNTRNESHQPAADDKPEPTSEAPKQPAPAQAASSPPQDSEASPQPSEEAGEEKQLLTAIYRPESKAAWREELRAANEKAERVSRFHHTPTSHLTSDTCFPR